MVLLYWFVCMNLGSILNIILSAFYLHFIKLKTLGKIQFLFILQLFSCLKLGILFSFSSPWIRFHFGALLVYFRIKLILLSFQKDFLIKIQNKSLNYKEGHCLQSTRHSLLLYSGSLCSSFITAEISNCEAVPAGVAQAISHSNRCLGDEIPEEPDGPNPFSCCLAVVHY